MIVSETVQTKWNNKHAKHYLDKGYPRLKANESFDVMVNDLLPKSSVKVTVKCDSCGKERVIPYSLYKISAASGNLCYVCANGIKNIERARKQALNGESFLQYFSNLLGDDFIDKYWSDKNTLDPSLICPCSGLRVYIKCQNVSYHDDYIIRCADFYSGCRCSQCGTKQTHPDDSLGANMNKEFGEGCAESRWSDKNELSSYTFAPTTQKWAWFTCPDNTHDDYYQQICVATYVHYHCPYCSRQHTKSYIQKSVEDYIIHKYNYTMLFENHCTLYPTNPMSGHKLRYDLELAEIKLIIEVHGEQHYAPNKYYSNHYPCANKTPEDELRYTQAKDKYKREYAISHGYSYLEISYKSERNGTYKQLIDDAITKALLELLEAV